MAIHFSKEEFLERKLKAIEKLKEKKLDSISLMSVSKGEKRNAGREIIHTLNQASGGCFRNIGFDKVKFNGGKWDTIIHLYEQKKYFGVMLRAVIQEGADGKLSVVYIGMLSPRC